MRQWGEVKWWGWRMKQFIGVTATKQGGKGVENKMRRGGERSFLLTAVMNQKPDRCTSVAATKLGDGGCLTTWPSEP